jgi:hypothetical protein
LNHWRNGDVQCYSSDDCYTITSYAIRILNEAVQ